MHPASTFFRETGDGPGVVCLHANASSSSQWRALAGLLEPRHRVLAPDAYGAGRGPAWPADRHVGLHDEAALLDPVFARAGTPFALIGHSYGAAVALVRMRVPNTVQSGVPPSALRTRRTIRATGSPAPARVTPRVSSAARRASARASGGQSSRRVRVVNSASRVLTVIA